MLHCIDCGHVGPNKGEDVDTGAIMDQLESGEIDYDEYSELMSTTRFVCDECGGMNTSEFDSED